MSLKRLLSICVAAGFAAFPAFAEMQLVMVEEHGCMWCEQWDEELSAIYPKTDEGRQAPLRRHDIHDDLPEGLALSRPLNFTPTFVLIVDGVEMSRIEGYPGEDFFWGLLAMMIADAEKTMIAEGKALQPEPSDDRADDVLAAAQQE